LVFSLEPVWNFNQYLIFDAHLLVEYGSPDCSASDEAIRLKNLFMEYFKTTLYNQSSKKLAKHSTSRN
jgi:hypothetical protein